MARRTNAAGPHGLVVIDKDAGWTSHDVVAKLRGLLAQPRTGHAGTLDPSATGVLLVGVGSATRLLRFLQETSKDYEGELALGATTTTLDADGEVTATFTMAEVTPEQAIEAARGLTGVLAQIPPMVSAIKVDGVRLHQLAREGIEIERVPRQVTVERFDVEATADPLRYRFEVRCSSGTYVRSLVDDLGRALGGGAHLATLRRTRVGSFGLADAHRLEELMARAASSPGPDGFADLVLSPAEALRGLDTLVVDEQGVDHVRHGRALEDTVAERRLSEPVAVLDTTGSLLGVYEVAGEGRLNPVVVLAGPPSA